MMTLSTCTCIDLFAGTGAFSHVLAKYGIQCVYANDMEKSSQAIYTANHSHPFHLKNLLEVDVVNEIREGEWKEGQVPDDSDEEVLAESTEFPPNENATALVIEPRSAVLTPCPQCCPGFHSRRHCSLRANPAVSHPHRPLRVL